MQEKVFPPTEGLDIKEELLSIHALNPFIANISASRAIMFSQHFSQALTLEYGDEPIIQTGLEAQLGTNTFNKSVDEDIRVISMVKRYGGIDENSVKVIPEYIIIYENLITNEIDIIEIPVYFSLHQYFGFGYRWNVPVLQEIRKNSIIPKNTVFADSPSVSEDGVYKYGVNANTAFLTTPEVAEDGMVISKSFSKKLEYKIYERKAIEFGADKFPLNLYGDKDNYKPFPEIGEFVNDDAVLMALRHYDSELAPALTSVNDTMAFNPIFDECHYCKKPGSKIVDIKVYTNPRFKKEVYNGTSDNVNRYVNGLKRYYQDILSVYDEISKEHYRTNRNNNVKVSDNFNKLLLDAYAIVNPAKKNIGYTFKKESMDIYRVEFTIETVMHPNIGGKISEKAGGKGVIVSVWDDDKMPVSETGERADIITDPTSIVSRMNIGRLYEQYFCSVSRNLKRMTTIAINKYAKKDEATVDTIHRLEPTIVVEEFKDILAFYSLFGTEQYIGYKEISTTNNVDAMREILLEIITKEAYIYYKVSSPKKAYQIVMDIKDTKFATKLEKVYFNENGTAIKGKTDMMIAPIYFMLLFKTGDEFLSSASAAVNHYGFPIGMKKHGKMQLPWRNNPTKVVSETEGRLYTAYGSRKAMAEIKDRANSLDTHASIYQSILKHPTPSNVDRLIDRTDRPYGNDSGIQLIDNIFNCMGIDVKYKQEEIVDTPDVFIEE